MRKFHRGPGRPHYNHAASWLSRAGDPAGAVFRGKNAPQCRTIFRNIKMPKVMLWAGVNNMSESCP
jgi:hypothetical protein